MPVRLITAPASEPVTRAEAKAHLRIDSDLTSDDTYVDTLITAARQWAEEYCWRGFVTQTWELVLEEFPSADCPIELPKGNLSTITSVKYIDVNGVEQTWASANYVKDDTVEPGFIRLAYDIDWPSDARDQWDAVKIRYVVGWAVGSVPTPIKQAILLLVSQMYEHRVPEVTGTIVSKVDFAVEALLRPYRLARF